MVRDNLCITEQLKELPTRLSNILLDPACKSKIQVEAWFAAGQQLVQKYKKEAGGQKLVRKEVNHITGVAGTVVTWIFTNLVGLWGTMDGRTSTSLAWLRDGLALANPCG